MLTLTITHGASPDSPTMVCSEIWRLARLLGVEVRILVNGQWSLRALPTDSLSNVLGILEDEQRRTR